VTPSRDERPRTIEIGGRAVAPGERLRFDLPVARLPTHTQLEIPLTVLNGTRAGPVLWLSAAVHGDELNGVEIITRTLERLDAPLRRGALVAAPVVNVFGFIGQSRYLPDRRDLNRSFPGSRTGSLASRIAHLFMTEVVSRCTHGIDLHTAAQARTNLPHVRGDLRDPETRRIAEAFAAPVMLQSTVRDGSLRAAARRRGVPTILFEGGEPQRFDGPVIEVGVRGVLGVLHALGMLGRRLHPRGRPSVELDHSRWVRARRGGLLRLTAREGERVRAHQPLGTIADPFGEDEVSLVAPFDGLVLGHATNPVVHGGDAVVHLGRIGPPGPAPGPGRDEGAGPPA